MPLKDREENLIKNIERIGADRGWSGWQIRGAQATAVLLFPDVPSAEASPDPSDADLAALAQHVVSEMALHQLPLAPLVPAS